MKKLKYIVFSLAGMLLFSSCMGDDYAEAGYTETPFGNNTIEETNVVSIAELKQMYSAPISTDYRDGTSYAKVNDSLQIKGIVTSSDIQGNVYNELALQDKTGAIIVSIAQGGLYSFLPVGTEVLINLKDLYVGNYGLQAQIGVPTVNAKGQTSIGRISRATWDQHYRILSTGNEVTPEEFDINKWDLTKDAGKLGVIRNVTFKRSDSPEANRDTTYANSTGGAGSASWTLNEVDGRKLIVYNSNYSDFANAKVPTYPVDITGIFKRFNNKWEIIIRSLDDVQPAATALYEEGFSEATGGWTAYNINLSEGLNYVWGGSSYGAKASAYVAGTNHAAESYLVSPEIDLSTASNPQLIIEQAANFLGSTFDENCKILVSTNFTSDPAKAQWTELKLDNVPTAETRWNMVTGQTSIAAFAGKKIHLAFHYVSTTSTAPTWEIRNVTIK